MLINFFDYELVKIGIEIHFSFYIPKKNSRIFNNLVEDFKNSNVYIYGTADSENCFVNIPDSTKDSELSHYYFSALVEYNSITTSTIETLRGLHTTITDISKAEVDRCVYSLYKCISVLQIYIIQVKAPERK